MDNIEIVGYLATVFILSSFVVSKLKVLRIVNSIGGVLWMIYGFTVGSSSILIGNLLMVIIHLVKLYKENQPINKVKRYNAITNKYEKNQ